MIANRNNDTTGTLGTIALSAVAAAVRNRHSVAIGTANSTCGNYKGRCTNLWKCQQRQKPYGGKCFPDLINQVR